MCINRAEIVLFSDARSAVIRALVRDHGYLPVTICLEPDNRADPKAVAIVSALPSFVVGGRSVYPAGEESAGEESVGQRIGYVRRADPDRAAIAARIDVQDGPIEASLLLDGHDWRVEFRGETVEDDEGIPY